MKEDFCIFIMIFKFREISAISLKLEMMNLEIMPLKIFVAYIIMKFLKFCFSERRFVIITQIRTLIRKQKFTDEKYTNWLIYII